MGEKSNDDQPSKAEQAAIDKDEERINRANAARKQDDADEKLRKLLEDD